MKFIRKLLSTVILSTLSLHSMELQGDDNLNRSYTPPSTPPPLNTLPFIAKVQSIQDLMELLSYSSTKSTTLITDCDMFPASTSMLSTLPQATQVQLLTTFARCSREKALAIIKSHINLQAKKKSQEIIQSGHSWMALHCIQGFDLTESIRMANLLKSTGFELTCLSRAPYQILENFTNQPIASLYHGLICCNANNLASALFRLVETDALKRKRNIIFISSSPEKLANLATIIRDRNYEEDSGEVFHKLLATTKTLKINQELLALTRHQKQILRNKAPIPLDELETSSAAKIYLSTQHFRDLHRRELKKTGEELKDLRKHVKRLEKEVIQLLEDLKSLFAVLPIYIPQTHINTTPCQMDQETMQQLLKELAELCANSKIKDKATI